MYKLVFKPTSDFFLALVGLIILSPIFLLVIVGLALANSGKPFFMQLRPGKNSRVFKLIKFKTMNDRKDASHKLLPDNERITKVGKFVRSTSLDEIPQLINVLKGDMSLVGPRPLLTKYLPLYSEFQSRRHEVKPGITGWSQVNGRNNLSWDEKFKMDVWYVDNVSFLLDMKILLITIKKVFIREGVTQVGQATSSAFKGNK